MAASPPAKDQEPDPTPKIGALVYRVIIDCASEHHQAELMERLENEGLTCRPLIA